MKTLALIVVVVCASIFIDAGQGTVVITSPAYPGKYIYYGNLQDSERVLEGVKVKQSAGTDCPGPCKACKRETGPWDFEAPLQSEPAFEARLGRSASRGGVNPYNQFVMGVGYAGRAGYLIPTALVHGTQGTVGALGRGYFGGGSQAEWK